MESWDRLGWRRPLSPRWEEPVLAASGLTPPAAMDELRASAGTEPVAVGTVPTVRILAMISPTVGGPPGTGRPCWAADGLDDTQASSPVSSDGRRRRAAWVP